MAEHFDNGTPGQLLRAARESRGFSLQQAYEGTKIPVRLLEAIERDEYHKLSGPLYVKSFLQNYAGWLELDEGQVLRVYELATGRPEQTPSSEEQVWSEDQVAVTRIGVPWARLVIIGVAAAVLLVVLVLVAVRLLSGGDEPEAAAGPTSGQAAASAVVAEPPVVDEAAVIGQDDAGDAAVQSRTQPSQRTETAAERLARLDRDHLGSPPADEPAAAAAPQPVELSPPRRGVPELRFAGGETFPLVLRVVLPEPANCAVRRDDQPAAVPVIWPDRPVPPPAYNLRHGLAYAVRGGYAVYWGAADHFTLTLDRVHDAEVTLNGHPQRLAGWRPGQTKLLDMDSLPDGG